MEERDSLTQAAGRNLFILNSAVLCGFGTYHYSPLHLEDARRLLKLVPDFISCVGHELTANILSQLTGINIPVNRRMAMMYRGDKAIVFRLTVRLPEGTVIKSLKELSDIAQEDEPWELGLLEKVE